MRFEYEKLVGMFENSLLTELRGHGAGSDFLRMWVPDTEPAKSLINMADAAGIESVDGFEVDIATASLSAADITELSSALSGTYKVSTVPGSSGRTIVAFRREGGK